MTLRRAFGRVPTALGALAACLMLAGPALAQNFEKVEDAGREQLPATPFVAIAYGFIWVAVLVYAFGVARRLGRLRGELDDLRRKIDRGDAPTGR